MTVHLHKESETIRIKKGVRQGDTISSKLFTATLESIFRRLNWENRASSIFNEVTPKGICRTGRVHVYFRCRRLCERVFTAL